MRRRAPARDVLRYHPLLFANGDHSADAGPIADADAHARACAMPDVSARDDVAAGTACARGPAAHAMPGPDDAYAFAVPYSDAMP